MSNVSLERYYFVLYDGALTSKMSKMALNAFCDKTLQMYAVQIRLSARSHQHTQKKSSLLDWTNQYNKLLHDMGTSSILPPPLKKEMD